LKALKYRSGKSNITPTAVLAASLATTLGCLGIAYAQTDTDANPNANPDAKIDIETCQALNDSTALDQESINTRIACYSRDVEHLNQLVSQLITERDNLVSSAETQSETIEDNKQELAQRQDAMQRLEERAAGLLLQIDDVTAERDQVREQLIEMISANKEQPVEVAANKIIFENFSQSYLSLTSEISELRERLSEFETANTELADQQLATQNENQQLQSQNEKLASQITSLEESVAALESEKEELQASLSSANADVENINKQLLENADLAEQRLGEIADLKTALETSENQRKELEGTIASLNEKHLEELTGLTDQAETLNGEIDTLKKQQLALHEQKQQATDESQTAITARDDEIAQLSSERKALNIERVRLIAHIASLEKSHQEQTRSYKDQAGVL